MNQKQHPVIAWFLEDIAKSKDMTTCEECLFFKEWTSIETDVCMKLNVHRRKNDGACKDFKRDVSKTRE